MAGNPLIALQAKAPDVIGSYYAGKDQAQAYEINQTNLDNNKTDRARADKERILGYLVNAADRVKSPQEFEQWKGTFGKYLPEAAPLMAEAQFSDLAQIKNGLVSLAEQQKIDINNQTIRQNNFDYQTGVQEQPYRMQGLQMDVEGKRLGLDATRQQNNYWNEQLGGTPAAASAPMAPAQYQPLIEQASQRTGLPVGLITAQMAQESNFDPNAQSGAGAGGLMQLMPGTATNPGYGIAGISERDRFDPAKNVETGTAYMAALVKQFGNIPDALVAYNWGPGNAQNWVKNGRDVSRLPRETRDYVQRITSRMGEAGPMGAGQGVGTGNPLAPPAGPVVQGGSTSFNGQPVAPAGQLAAGTPQPAPMAPPQPSPAPQAAQSIVEMAQNDPLIQKYRRDGLMAQRNGDTFGAQNAKAMIDARLKELEATAPKPMEAPSFENENALRNQYRLQAQPLADAVSNASVMDGLAGDQTGASDVALVFSFFKTIDPTSTVREGEYAAAASAQGLPGQIVTAFARLDSGEKLSPELRQQLVAVSKRYAAQSESRLQALNQKYGTVAQTYGINPDNVLIYPTQPGATPSQPLPPELQGMPDGTEVEDEQGNRAIIRNGQLVPK